MSSEGRSLTPNSFSVDHNANEPGANSLVCEDGARPGEGDIPLPPLRASDRFRAAVRKVIAIHRTQPAKGYIERGLDPRHEAADRRFAHVQRRCSINLADYSAIRCLMGKMVNREFVRFVQDRQASQRLSWCKVRWIHISNLSWDVVRAVGLKYNIHPLALETIMSEDGEFPSRSDYYAGHLFLRFPCLSCSLEADNGGIEIRRNYLSVILFRDGTLISFYDSPFDPLFQEIYPHILERSSRVRASPDASLLLHCLLDYAVRQTVGVVNEMRITMLELERTIYTEPKMRTVKRLHLLSGIITAQKHTLEPFKILINTLREYDADRVRADYEIPADEHVEGYVSRKAKVYLRDAEAQVDFALKSMELFASNCENLINYNFNMASFLVMRRLTLYTIIFTPLSLLTGYFGMNFQSMWSTENHTDIFFWMLALPIMSIIIPTFLWSDILKWKDRYTPVRQVQMPEVPESIRVDSFDEKSVSEMDIDMDVQEPGLAGARGFRARRGWRR